MGRRALLSGLLAAAAHALPQLPAQPYSTPCITTTTKTLPPHTFILTDALTYDGMPLPTMHPTGAPIYVTVYTTVYAEFCPTGLQPATYTITETCTGPPKPPHPTYVPPGFTVTVTTCHVCGDQPITATLTVPCEEDQKPTPPPKGYPPPPYNGGYGGGYGNGCTGDDCPKPAPGGNYPPVKQIPDGQPQNNNAGYPPVKQIPDGQPQNPSGDSPSYPPVKQIPDGQPQNPSGGKSPDYGSGDSCTGDNCPGGSSPGGSSPGGSSPGGYGNGGSTPSTGCSEGDPGYPGCAGGYSNSTTPGGSGGDSGYPGSNPNNGGGDVPYSAAPRLSASSLLSVYIGAVTLIFAVYL